MKGGPIEKLSEQVWGAVVRLQMGPTLHRTDPQDAGIGVLRLGRGIVLCKWNKDRPPGWQGEESSECYYLQVVSQDTSF